MRLHRSGRHAREAGLSLIEVMIALVVLGVGLLTIAAAQLTSLRMGTKSKHMQQAMYLAQEQLELFQIAPPQAAGTFQDPANPIDVFPNDRDLTGFNRSWQVTQNTPQAGLSTVAVTVVWNNSVGNNGAPRSVTLTGIVGGAGP
jgi:type IV pilus assembly protein PilV